MRTHYQTPMCHADIAEVRWLRKQGFSWASISQIVGRPSSTIRDSIAERKPLPRSPAGRSWTETKIETLKKRWAQGWSATQIACELGDVSRNAVIGKVHRLGLSGRATNWRERDKQQSRQKRMTKPRSVTWTRHKPRVSAQPMFEPAPDVPPENRVKHNDLEAHHCRWPCGDPKDHDFGFCGAASVPGKPYCAHHTHVAHNPPELRPVTRETEKEPA